MLERATSSSDARPQRRHRVIYLDAATESGQRAIALPSTPEATTQERSGQTVAATPSSGITGPGTADAAVKDDPTPMGGPEKPSRPAGQASTDEPFGQVGIRRYLVPAITTLSFALTCVAGIMWHRSLEYADSITRTDGRTTLAIRSIYGRVVITYTRFSYEAEPETERFPILSRSAEWSYGWFDLPEVVRDAWRESLLKTIGVEWRGEPLVFDSTTAVRGWWLRVKWHVIVLLTLIIPLARAVAHQIRSWRGRERGVV